MIRGSIWKSNIQLIGLPGKRKTLKIQKEGRKEGGRERKKEKETNYICMYVWEPHKNMRFKKQPGFEAIYHPELKKGTGSGASRWEGN